MSISSLRLFGVVPQIKGFTGRYEVDTNYGVIVTPDASYDLQNIRKWLKEVGVGANETNSAFYSDWKTISRLSDFQMRMDQLLHYFTTYGLEYFGVDSVREGLVYIPNNVFNTPIHAALKIVEAQSPEELVGRCFKMLNSGMALSQKTVKDIIAVLTECDYEITGDEQIANREAQAIFYDISGKLPTESTRLFRYLVFYFSGSSMVINDRKTREAITASGKRLPYLDVKRLNALAQSFNRYKDLWMAIKKANTGNGPTVNVISKLSKSQHVPMKQNILNSLTSEIHSSSEVIAAAEGATVFQLVRAYNALRLREEDIDGWVYRIRNGKLWTVLGGKPASIQASYNALYQKILLNVLRERFQDIKVYCPVGVDYSIPVSEKSFVGNLPEGTIIRIPQKDKTFLIGIHWDDPQTDLDLRAESSGLSIGWNTNLRNSYHTIMHSGDMTRAPKPLGASEWIYFSQLSGTFNLKLNLFAGYDFSKKFKFIIGQSNKENIEKGYSIAPSEIFTSYTVEMEERQMNLGMLYPEKDFICYLVGNASTGNRHVGRYTKYDVTQQNFAAKRIQSALRLADMIQFVDSPEKAVIDLSLDKLTKDTFLGLINKE